MGVESWCLFPGLMVGIFIVERHLGPFHVSLVTGMAQLARWILLPVHKKNSSPLSDIVYMTIQVSTSRAYLENPENSWSYAILALLYWRDVHIFKIFILVTGEWHIMVNFPAQLRPIYTVRFLLTIVACDFCSARCSRHEKIVYDFHDIKLPVATIVVGF